MERIQISIITVNYNNASGLEKTIKSVLEIDLKGVEYLVIDGNSTDGSLNIIKENEEKINYWVSEKDDGIYQAMNKGIEKATGEYLMFLNSGDCLIKHDTIQKCAEVILKYPHTDIVYGDIIAVNDATYKKKWEQKYPPELSLEFFKSSTINHQASFIKRNLFTEFGLYPEQYKLASDYWLYLKSMLNNKTFTYLDFPVVVYDNSGLSVGNLDAYLTEKKNIWETVVPKSIRSMINQNEYYKSLVEAKIVKSGIFINNIYQRLRNRK